MPPSFKGEGAGKCSSGNRRRAVTRSCCNEDSAEEQHRVSGHFSDGAHRTTGRMCFEIANNNVDKGFGMISPSGCENEIEDSVEYAEDEEYIYIYIYICNVEGVAWESLPYLVIIDSGAARSAFPGTLGEHIGTCPVAESRKGLHVVVADGGETFKRCDGSVSPSANKGRQLCSIPEIALMAATSTAST